MEGWVDQTTTPPSHHVDQLWHWKLLTLMGGVLAAIIVKQQIDDCSQSQPIALAVVIRPWHTSQDCRPSMSDVCRRLDMMTVNDSSRNTCWQCQPSMSDVCRSLDMMTVNDSSRNTRWQCQPSLSAAQLPIVNVNCQLSKTADNVSLCTELYTDRYGGSTITATHHDGHRPWHNLVKFIQRCCEFGNFLKVCH